MLTLLIMSCATTPDEPASGATSADAVAADVRPRVVAQQGMPPEDGLGSKRAHLDVRAGGAAVGRGRRVQLWDRSGDPAGGGTYQLAAEAATPTILDLAWLDGAALIATRGGVLRLSADGALAEIPADVGDDVVYLAAGPSAAVLVTPAGLATVGGGPSAPLPDGAYPTGAAVGAADDDGSPVLIVQLDGAADAAIYALPGLERREGVSATPAARPAGRLDEDGTLTLGEQTIPGRVRWRWLAAGGGVWCVGTAADGRCFRGAERQPLPAARDASLRDGVPVLLIDGAAVEGDVTRPVAPDARMIAAGAGSIAAGGSGGRLWMVDGDDPPAELSVGQSGVSALEWSADGLRVASGSTSGEVFLVDTRAQEFRPIGRFDRMVLGLAWGQGGRLSVALDGEPVHTIDLDAEAPSWRAEDYSATAIAISPDGVVATTDDSGAVTLRPGGTLPAPVHARALAWAGADQLAWIGDTAGLYTVSDQTWQQILAGPEWAGVDQEGRRWGAAGRFRVMPRN